jgi:hypothetical protein
MELELVPTIALSSIIAFDSLSSRNRARNPSLGKHHELGVVSLGLLRRQYTNAKAARCRYRLSSIASKSKRGLSIQRPVATKREKWKARSDLDAIPEQSVAAAESTD